MKIILIVASVFIALGVNAKSKKVSAPATAPVAPAVVAKIDTLSFAAFQSVLDKHVTEVQKPDGGFETYVNYQKIYDDADSRKNLSDQLKLIEGFDPAKLKTKDEAMSFWINTYNCFMLSKILKDGFKDGKLSINSVKDLGSVFSPYKAFSQKDFQVGGKEMTLDEVEKGTLLGPAYKAKSWKDARVHFAVNCASVGCPPIIKKVYTPETASAVLDENIRKALKTKRHFNIEGDKVNVTHLAKWYKGDFVDQFGSVANFLAKYLSDESAKQKVQTDKFEYIDYDWKLNRAENFK